MKIIFLFSGKRKVGKDFVTNIVQEKLKEENSVIVRLSGPIKEQYAASHDLDNQELLTSSAYKEAYRKNMIIWSENIRSQNHGYFIKEAVKMYKAENHKVWIISDMRRRSDLNWFKDNYPKSVICPIKIFASDQVRISRGFQFTKGVDDAESECDLDSFNNWKFTFENNSSDLKEWMTGTTQCRLSISYKIILQDYLRPGD